MTLKKMPVASCGEISAYLTRLTQRVEYKVEDSLRLLANHLFSVARSAGLEPATF